MSPSAPSTDGRPASVDEADPEGQVDGEASAATDGVAIAAPPSADAAAPPPSDDAIAAALGAVVGAEHVERGVPLGDASGLTAVAPVVVHPGDAEEVASTVAWAYGHGVAIVPVGGRTGYSGGIVPEGGAPQVAVALDRLDRVRSFDPLLWRAEVEAGVTTATVQRLARESGLHFPPDPGAPEQSQIGGNLATNAGGPHAFKHGVTGRWVTGIEAVIAPGELVRFGGPLRKDVAGYDLRGLLIGSEGTLGIITAAWLRFVPAPPTAVPVVAGYGSISAGVEAIRAVLASGVVPATLEYVQGTALRHAPPPFLDARDVDVLVVAEAESDAERVALLDALGPGARVHDAAEVWRWRSGVSLVVRAVRGEKLAEDISVPLDRLAEAIQGTLDIGAEVGLEATSWGHAGDGNLHATFLYDPADPEHIRRAQAAANAVFDLARELGGSVSGEHGLGVLKRGQLLGQWSSSAVAAHEAIKHALDPANLFNPGKKLGRPTPDG
ncbi:FAD-linked oxidase C-terminal domain-containing protein [Patulibacter sp. NPDC049589]|uniref:FAD-binding oxidoreductase n=1 Tax=Patulibacter sp. NPDC049589 TaxID=3154731 RepID=UPI003416AFD5